MRFVLADIVTFNKLYAKDSHMYVSINSLQDLEGFVSCTVIIHEFDALDSEQEALQLQLEALASFGVINVTYMDDEGNENKFFNLIEGVLP